MINPNGVVARFSLAWGRNPVGVVGRRELAQGFSEGLRSNLGLEDEIPLGFSEVAPNPKGIPPFSRSESQRDSALQPLQIPNGFRPSAAPNPKGIPPSSRFESQRDSVLQPGVARNELPREWVICFDQPQRRVFRNCSCSTE